MDESKKVNKVEVIVSGKVITFVATESEAYVRMLAKYIDEKITQIQGSKSSFSMSSLNDLILIAINIADDMFKERQKIYNLDASLNDMKQALDKKDLELSKLKERNIGLSKDNQALANKNKSLLNSLEMEKVDILQKAEQENERLQGEIASLKKKFEQGVDADKQILLANFEAEKQKMRSDFDSERRELESKLALAQKNIKSNSDSKDKLKRSNAESENKDMRSKYYSMIEALKKENEKELRKIQIELDETIKKLAAAKEENESLTKELDTVKEKLITAEKELNDFIDAFDDGSSGENAKKTDNVVEFVKMS